MAVTSGANPWGERGSYDAQEAFIKKWGYTVARRKAAEVDVILPDPNPWGERWSPLAQKAYIENFGFAAAKRRAAEVGAYLVEPPEPPLPPQRLPNPLLKNTSPNRVYIIKGRPGPTGKDGAPGSAFPLPIGDDS